MQLLGIKTICCKSIWQLIISSSSIASGVILFGSLKEAVFGCLRLFWTRVRWND